MILTLQEEIMELEKMTGEQIFVEPFLDGWILFSRYDSSQNLESPIFEDITGDTPMHCVKRAKDLLYNRRV